MKVGVLGSGDVGKVLASGFLKHGHGFQGAGERPARVLVFDAPATAEGFFREASREVKNIPDDLVKIPEIGLRHNLRFQAPAR